ncbi:MAG: Nif3-like dinuclear metal center hexameric protein [Flavobacteriaceae bacterium]|nr:Nif3-like dinuclear metal center hexameric protein [Flavobacteriaceae bacterium]RCL66208.1 MAG: Nif3-like dinuclear metal center hexameric protein [Cryomorphaceae bacterium]
MKLKEIINLIEKWAPLELAEDFDNVGLILGDENVEVKKALITLDTLENVVDEAVENKCDLIISFHPIIFDGLKKITNKTYVKRVISKSIKNNINIYAIHTNLDNHPKGVNFQISKYLNLNNTKILIPKIDCKGGMGMIGELHKPAPEKEFLNYVKGIMKTSLIKHSTFLNKKIKKVAVLGGSGSFAIEEAIKAGADCFITADLKYHDYFRAENKILLLDIGHYESEQYTKELILNFLRKKIPKFACVISKSNTNPVNYF